MGPTEALGVVRKSKYFWKLKTGAAEPSNSHIPITPFHRTWKVSRPIVFPISTAIMRWITMMTRRPAERESEIATR
jgi:hypothetical protein